MSIYSGSRYTNTQTYYPKDSDREVFGIRKRKQMDLTNATFHTWTSSDTLDYLSYKIYGDSKYWWAFLDANPMYQTEFDIKVGDLIKVPPYSEVVYGL